MLSIAALQRRFLSGLIFLVMFFSLNLCARAELGLERTIDDFHLSGFSEKGELTWEISGRTANIFSEQIRINDIIGKIYGQEEIELTARQGDFDRLKNKMRLQENVVITTSSGAQLVTDYLDWDRETSYVTTEAPVDIKRDLLVTTGQGLEGDLNLESIDLKKDVKVEIGSPQERIIITCEGPLSIDYNKHIAVFHKNVFVDEGQSQIEADLMEVFFVAEGAENQDDSLSAGIKTIIAKGNVKITRGANTSFADKAVYDAENLTLTLTGRPKLIIQGGALHMLGEAPQRGTP